MTATKPGKWRIKSGSFCGRLDVFIRSSKNYQPMANLERLAAKMICIGFDGPEVTAEARRLLERGAGAVVLFKRNFQSARQFVDLCATLKRAAGDRPLAICIDHEGGRVVRLGEPFTQIPSMRA